MISYILNIASEDIPTSTKHDKMKPECPTPYRLLSYTLSAKPRYRMKYRPEFFGWLVDLGSEHCLIKRSGDDPYLIDKLGFKVVNMMFEGVDVYEEFGPEQVKHEHEQNIKNNEEDRRRL